jgi:ketosteroid isomerase-like protein
MGNEDREIVLQEERLTQATRNIDVDALDRLYADDIMFTGVTGAICNKTQVMDEARRGLAERQRAAAAGAAAEAQVVDYSKDDVRTVRHGDTAVSSFAFGVTIRNDGKEVTRKYRTTNVWIKKSGEWSVVAAHTALLG